MPFDRYPPASVPPGPVPGPVREEGAYLGEPARIGARSVTRDWRQYVVPGTLLLLTVGTTTLVGTQLAANFHANRSAFDLDRDLPAYLELLRNPIALIGGLPFSLTLISILLFHELGHYVACRYYGVDATLPYFLPAPTFIGTFGAFIRIRSPIYSKRVLFDIGAAGPIAGFVALAPALAVGLAYSKVIPGMGVAGDLIFGVPLIQHILQAAIFPGTASADIYLHPVARAAWVGVFATALNLLPIGQLDGGHILYAINAPGHKHLSRFFIASLIPLGAFFWSGWWFWAAVLFFFARRHPVIYDEARLSPGRVRLASVCLGIFILTFSVAPIATSLSR